MTDDSRAFVASHTEMLAAAFVPEITLRLASEVTPLWHMTEEQMGQGQLPPPFWAFAWPGGQGLARYLLDHPSVVTGKKVLDFGAGSGIGAIAAGKAGAAAVVACDIDPFAQAAISMNAGINQISVEILTAVDFSQVFRGADIILAGDVCYQQSMSATVTRWLLLNREAGKRVLLADPGRAWVPEAGLFELASYKVPTSKELEDEDMRIVKVWDFGVEA